MIKEFILHLEWNRGYRPHFSIKRRSRPGDRVVDGGVPGMLIACEECSGDGLLLQEYGRTLQGPIPSYSGNEVLDKPFTREDLFRNPISEALKQIRVTEPHRPPFGNEIRLEIFADSDIEVGDSLKYLGEDHTVVHVGRNFVYVIPNS